MFPKEDVKSYVLGDDLKVTILESGNLKEIRKGIIRLNTYVGNNLEPTISNIYMRVEEDNNYFVTRLIGIGSPSSFKIVNNQAIYSGTFLGCNYTVWLTVTGLSFIYRVQINKNNFLNSKKITIFYGMDVSISNIYAINNNEAYVSQYVDHKAYSTDNGYIICSRQNQDTPCYLEQGSLTPNVGYCVDGFQFFGTSYKQDNCISGLKQKTLPNEIYQYEFGYCVLQSETVALNENHEFIFYGVYNDSHPLEVTGPLYTEYVKKNAFKYNNIKTGFTKVELRVDFNNVLTSLSLTEDEVNSFYPQRSQIEVNENKLYSFFTENKSHIVFPDKEKVMERPSGNILISLTNTTHGKYDFEKVLADTCYMYGVFSSQIVLGNTSFNKLMANQRNPLNVQKITGQRIFVKINESYQLLGMPSVFEMGLNYCKWLYKIENDIIIINTVISTDTPKVMLSVKSLNNIKYDFIVSNLLTMGQNENENKVHINEENGEIYCKFDKASMTYNKYPEIYFKIKIDKQYSFSDDRIFYIDNKSRNENILTFNIFESEFNILIIGEENNKQCNEYDNYINIERENKKYLENIRKLVNDFNLVTSDIKVASYNYLVYWYAHNALVHYLSPHGLEQYNGAAWGTRDVCQGPAEFFLAMNKFSEVRRILLNVYEHQFIDNGSFPQWFMFDRFSYIQDSGSHGDIIVWPARLLSIYLEKTHDYSILDEQLVYSHRNIGTFTTEKYSLLHHLKTELDSIEASFIKGTYLSCYGGGDWDDTLQPANIEDREKMVSGWTVSLTYEMYHRLGKILQNHIDNLANKYLDLANKIKDDYNKYIMKDGTPSGFIHFEGEKVRYIIHPTDKITKMKYRLLPFTRGIISEIFDLEQVANADEVIKNNLMFPDGVRLMDNTVTYKGGIKTFFNRAETAANFGREIGLLYCHAHIRYCEAMQTLGHSKELYEGLLKINPVVVHSVVSNSLPRQRNSYFSSSDGDFLNRYQATMNFNKLKTGEVKVKGGWRIYSSGPGIYLSTLITGMLGLKVMADKIIFDPVIYESLNGLEFNYCIKDKKIKVKYFVSNNRKLLINNKEIKSIEFSNLYRFGGFVISYDDLSLDNYIELYMGKI